jgi:DNA helicase-2/ATP-dependent DNA helicase PcrA
MKFHADLHVHSKHSYATSRDCDLEHMAFWAGRKGVTVLGTGDFTHPQWWREIREKLAPAEPGLFRLRPAVQQQVEGWPGSSGNPVRFMLEVEISTIYKKDGKTRKVHHLVYAPDLASADNFRRQLARIGNIESDGRPIVRLDSRDLLEMVLESGDGCYLVPAHIWTPWFAVLGAKSGFDDLEECYGDLTGEIFAVETGLSSDPPMNRRLSRLDRFTLVSNSDAHSPQKIGREACVFDTDLDYFAIRRALEAGQGYAGTVEFFPEEGKYHLDGHRKCGVCLAPAETRRYGGRCPSCGKPLTLGVVHRIDDLADRGGTGFRLQAPGSGLPQKRTSKARGPESEVRSPAPADQPPFRSLVPLDEVLAEVEGVGPKSKAVQRRYEELLRNVGPELFILESAPLDDVRRIGPPRVADALQSMREGRVVRQAGYDGQYGSIRLLS